MRNILEFINSGAKTVYYHDSNHSAVAEVLYNEDGTLANTSTFVDGKHVKEPIGKVLADNNISKDDWSLHPHIAH